MLKPMGKKSMAHPRLDEWRSAPTAVGSGPKLPSHLRSLLVPNAAALRLQLRYQKYQDKARALLKKADASQQPESATGAAKTGGRTVKGSSMALAVALKARQDEAELSAEQLKQSKSQPLYVRPEQHVSQTWSSSTKEWVVKSSELERAESSEDSTVDADESSVEGELVQKEVEGSMESDRSLVDVKEREQQGEVILLQNNDDEEQSEYARQHGFVNVMEPSWLLSSIEQRCAETASTLQAQSSTNPKSSLAMQFADVRLAMLDLLFICRAGVGVNLLGRPPSSVDVHHRNLVSRVKLASLKDDKHDLTPEDLNRVTRIFEGLKSDMFMPAVRCLGWLLTKTWRMLFHGLHVDVESLHQVRRVLEASEGDVSVVFAPTHKSHLDYLIISYLCFAYGIPLPRIAAGNNLDLPLVGSFLRANGSFFIRRSFRNDSLYKQVMEEYVHELLRDGNPVEVFIEGGRSRHGRVCKPRMGFMSMFLDYVKQPESHTFNDNDELDECTKKTVLVVPISLDYDKVYEVEEYANQLLGKPKEKESLAVLFRSVCDLLFLRCGHSYVRFGKPVPLTVSSSLEDSAQIVSERMQSSGTITSTSIVSALLMWKRAYMTEEMLKSRTVWLLSELEKRAATVAHVEDDDIATHALSILKVTTKTNGVVIPQLQYPVRALELGFYRNHLLHIFLQDMAVIGALDAALRDVSKGTTGGLSRCRVDIGIVKKETQQIWRFLCHICRHKSVEIDTYVDKFLREAIECDVNEMSGKVNVDLSRWNASKLVSFVLSLHWSFMDSLWLSAHGLWSLLPAKDDEDEIEHTERDVVRRVQVLAKELFLRQQLIHAEALCSESIKQSLEYFVERGLIRFERSHDGRARVLRLCLLASSSDPEHALEELTREVNKLRKPRSFLWRQDEFPRNLTCKEAQKLMEGAQGSRSIYAKWMAPPTATA
ncbi:putative methyltransferase-like protein 15 [Phytophthora boehmeriae]|uniref:Putative methyltransferase-like protein 15 n=1 Tax=Phytophthora boehmeriae TaxID=109152 RepID=A0A8T1X0A7_9STRA|nr:putative methyltransferase-like protein 15 [Phytophthora boehmeriae]